MPRKIPVELIENFLVVWNPKKGSELYKMGFYGKPLGIPKPKVPEFNVPLILDLMEGVYLTEKGIISVYEGAEKRKVSLKKLRQKAKTLYEEFAEKYAVYRDLRDKGFVVTPGIKFGCDFAVYKFGPGLEHAPYMVSVKRAEAEITATEIVKTGRLATTVRKRFIIALPDLKAGTIRYLIFKWFKA
ncbi:MAG: tRNA-intron lyase [Nitrososphaerota archaeon]|nr:tRNA-intron lyase [Candidatus Bathyarchaeota archaeon]MDW8022470.1 tRNA-intron lyase [Nitrososphaerota archaeon]